jgi:hypothetical protein
LLRIPDILANDIAPASDNPRAFRSMADDPHSRNSEGCQKADIAPRLWGHTRIAKTLGNDRNDSWASTAQDCQSDSDINTRESNQSYACPFGQSFLNVTGEGVRLGPHLRGDKAR